MSETTNYHLFLCDEDTKSFKEWREEINGSDVSNMTKIDAAVKEVSDVAQAALPAADYTADDILVKLKSVDGSGSGLDADLFKGNSTIPIANGGTGATTAAEAAKALKALKMLPDNSVSSIEEDTVETWTTLGSGYCFYNIKDCLVDQPNQYGFLVNLVRDYTSEEATDVFQIWKSQTTGALYVRSGNYTGWGSSWRKLFDDSQTIPIANGGTGATTASSACYSLGTTPLRHTVIGWSTPSTGSETAPIWLKLGEINCSGTYFTYMCLLAVNMNAGGDVAKLAITVRTTNTSGVLDTSASAIIVDVSSLRASSLLRNADRFVIDNSVTGKAVLYYKCWGDYPILAARVLHEQFSTSQPMSDSEKLQLVKSNYQGSFANLVLGTDYETSITQTIVGKSPVTDLSNSNSLPLDASFVLSRDLRYFTNRSTKVTASETGQDAMMRGIKLQTTDMTAGTTALTSGQICLVYE